jgi:hypothetical protein
MSYQLPPANPQTVAHFERQWTEAVQVSTYPIITCECGKKRALLRMFRCLYCGCFFCQACAEIHFGKTREQYAAEARAKQGQAA